MTNQDSAPRFAFASGAFLLVRRQTYDAVGGHAAVCDRLCEDVELARRLKSAGHRIRLFWGGDFLQVRMYNSLGQMFRGWGRIFAGGSRRRPGKIVLAILFVLLSCFSAYLALGLGLYHWLGHGGDWTLAAAGAAHLVLMSALLARMYRWAGQSRLNALLFPLGGAMLLALLGFALHWCITGRIEWRGTQYTHGQDSRVTPAGSSERG